ncbi:MAG: hypothetical protein ISN29_07260 [Gammaproteobacteria bacterium AqS3]|nr:hypothetical protein [Gammaproteobacteria bacterium AqS3]
MQTLQTSELRELLDLASEAARQAGAYLRSSRPEVAAHVGRDIKLVQDVEAEKIILGVLESSRLAVLAEESGGADLGDAPCWVIDPLDGTYNYYRGMHDCAACVGLWIGGAPRLGAIHHLGEDALYTGAAGIAAERDGAAVRPAGTGTLERAVLTTGITARSNLDAQTLTRRVQTWSAFRKVRMCGSAASAMLHVASGACDVYTEVDVMPWDVCASSAILEAAGGAHHWTPAASGHEGAWDFACAGSPQLLRLFLDAQETARQTAPK